MYSSDAAIENSSPLNALDYHAHQQPMHHLEDQVQELKEPYSMEEGRAQPHPLYPPPSPVQVIMVPRYLDERPVFSRHSLDNKAIFPARRHSPRASPQVSLPRRSSPLLDSLYLVFNAAYTSWTGTKEEKSHQNLSPGNTDANRSSITSEPTARERDGYESWPFIGTASHYDLDKFGSEDEEKSGEA